MATRLAGITEGHHELGCYCGLSVQRDLPPAIFEFLSDDLLSWAYAIIFAPAM